MAASSLVTVPVPVLTLTLASFRSPDRVRPTVKVSSSSSTASLVGVTLKELVALTEPLKENCVVLPL